MPERHNYYGGAVDALIPWDGMDRTRALAVDRAAQWPYPWVYRPIDGKPFSPQGAQVAPAYGIANQVLLAEYEVPQGYDGTLNRLYFYYSGGGFVSGSGDIVWTVDINTPLGVSPQAGYALPDYAQCLTPLGDNTHQWHIPGGYPLNEGDVVRVKGYTVQNVAVGVGNMMYGFLGGWTWPVLNDTGRTRAMGRGR